MAIGNNATRARSFDGRLDEARILGVPLVKGATIRRFDIHGRLVATARSTGNARTDAVDLSRNTPPGLHVDRIIAPDGSSIEAKRVILT